MKKISLVTSALLLSSTMAMAESNSIKEAFANGTTSGDITVYTESKDNKAATKNGFTAGSVGVTYSTDSFKGFNATVGFRANTELTEDKATDYDTAMVNKSSLTEANIKYEDDNFALIVGRQAIDLEWLGDYNDAVVGVVKMIPDTTVIVGYTDRKAEIGYDVVERFADIGNGVAGQKQKGAYVVDAKYAGVENLEVNPYAYSVPDLADYYGLKVSYDTDVYGATAHYATSNEDIAGTLDGNILHLEGRFNIVGVALAAGYIKTDKTGAIGSIAAAGDNINPLDDGTNVYGTDAKTVYASASYSIADLTLTALYGTTEYSAANTDVDELNLIAGYAITEELSAAVTYVNYDDDAVNNDYDKVFANITYAF